MVADAVMWRSRKLVWSSKAVSAEHEVDRVGTVTQDDASKMPKE